MIKKCGEAIIEAIITDPSNDGKQTEKLIS